MAQDTTDVDFTSPARNGRLGQLTHAEHFGFFVHSALALTAEGLPLGLLHQHVWMRSPDERGKRKERRLGGRKETADKESQRWLDTEAACLAALPADRTVVMIADRECDFYDYFAVARRPGQHVLVRAKLRRRIAESKELLGEATRAGPVQGTLTVHIPRKDGQPERQAMLAVRYGAFALQPPSTHLRRKELPTLPLRTLLVEEVNPPAGAKPLQWLLLTTLPIDRFADAERLVRWYTYRWRIERYHFTLKSGCRLEELQLETAERLRRALALVAMVAARLLHLTYLARQNPEAPCEPAVSAEEWEVLWLQFRPGEALPAQPPSLREAMRWIGRLGGFLARKGDGEPGVKVLWRGLRKLQAMVIGFRLAKAAAHGVQSSDE
jgi:Transposase Tn5 dimerisation domain